MRQSDCTIRIDLKVTADLPNLPNFIQINGVSTPIEAVSDSDLDRIGAAWTVALVEHARKRRCAPRP